LQIHACFAVSLTSILFFPAKPPWTTVCSSFAGHLYPCSSSLLSVPMPRTSTLASPTQQAVALPRPALRTTTMRRLRTYVAGSVGSSPARLSRHHGTLAGQSRRRGHSAFGLCPKAKLLPG
jgi:hypothetical protein